MLEVRNISAGYGSFRALFGVSIEVRAGEAVGVIGPNGAGKTTLLRVISKIISPESGHVMMQGQDLRQVAAHRVVEMGIAHVPEHRRLFPRLTVEENLRMGAFHPEARRRFAERLEFVYDLFPRIMLLPLLFAIPAGMIHSSATLLRSIEACQFSIKQRGEEDQIYTYQT